MKKRIIPILMAAAFSIATPVYAFNPIVIKDFRVSGLQRTEVGTVFSYLPMRIGDHFDDEAAAAAVRALYGTGFFDDVKVSVDGNVVVINVVERPSIGKISFEGMKAFKEEQIREALKTAGLAESRIFSRSDLDKAEQELKRQYLNKGLYSAKVRTSVTPLERNRVAIAFVVNEGSTARIKEINIIGNKKFRSKDLVGLFSLSGPGFFTFFSKSNQYSREKLTGDLETLKSFYLNRGYLDFNIESAQVSITPNRESIFITVNVTEGEKYTIKDVKVAGNLIIPAAEYRKLVRLQSGEVFSREKLLGTIEAINEKLGDMGYAFAQVNAQPDMDRQKKLVSLTFNVEPGQRVYVRRIDIEGNTKTRDEVVRREMRQLESAWYEGAKVRRSKTRLDKLGYFDEVTFDSEAVPGVADQTDLKWKVKERPTGNLQLGAGYSSAEKLVLSGSVTQRNLFGSGNSLSLSLDTSKIDRTIALSFTNPYWTADGLSLGWDVYHRRLDTESTSITPYRFTATGGGLRFGYPISEDDSIDFGIGVDRTSIETYPSSPFLYKNFCTEYNCNNLTSLLLSAGWSRDSRDSYLVPTDGLYQRLNLEVAVPPGNLKYYRSTYQIQFWTPVTKNSALSIGGDVGYADSYGDKPLPFYKVFYAGGIGSVRGYESSSLGSQYTDPVTKEVSSLGGDRRFVSSVEYYFPIPGLKDRSMRLSAFTDVGQVWAVGAPLDFKRLRSSYGLAFSWNSPVGPLKLSYGVPLRSNVTDKEQRFQFQLGTNF